MHRALLVEDTVSAVLGYLHLGEDNVTLLALATTNHVLSDAALDIMWEDVNVWDLAQRMDASLWTINRIGEDQDYELDLARSPPAELEHLGHRFLEYARRIRVLRINGEERGTLDPHYDVSPRVQRQVSPHVLSLWAQHSSVAVFPRLHRLVVYSPPFGGPWDVQIVLDLIHARPSMTAFELRGSDRNNKLCGQDLRVSTPVTGSIKICSSNHFPDSAMLYALLLSSPQVREVTASGCLTVAAMARLAALQNLITLDISTGHHSPDSLPLLPPSAFPELSELRIHERGASSVLFDLFAAMPPNPKLRVLNYRAVPDSTSMPRRYSLLANIRRLFKHIALCPALEYLVVEVVPSPDQHSLTVEETRTLFRHMHALPNLTWISFECSVSFSLTRDIVGDVLASCPRLDSWYMLFDGYHNVSAPIPFGELHATIHSHRAQRLPVCLRCDALPSLDEVRGLRPMSLAYLSVHDIKDPTALGTLLAALCPQLEWVGVDPCGLAYVDEDASRAVMASWVIEAARNAENGVSGSDTEECNEY